MNQSEVRKYSAETYQEACEWFVEFRTDDIDEGQRRKFYAWIQESPANVAAYLDVAKAWVNSGSMAIASEYPKNELISACANAEAEVIVPIAGSKFGQQPLPITQVPSTRKFGASLSSRPWQAIAACLVASVVIGVFLMWMGRDVRTYATGTGEHHSFVLSDGSMVNLNSRSRVRVHFVANERRVDLLEGQALFSVAKDRSRPFVVYSGLAQVKAVGTEFDVYRKASGTVVTVIEGRVAVVTSSDTYSLDQQQGAASLASVPKMVSAGEQLTIQADAAPRLTSLDIATAVNWTQGRLVFESTPLKEVVTEFNRYNERQIVIADAELEQFEIDGVFSSTDANALVQFLRRRQDMNITETGSQIIVRGQ